MDEKADITGLDQTLLDMGVDEELLQHIGAEIMTIALSRAAQIRREKARRRQAEGIAAAKKRGVKFGRKPKQIPEEFHYLRKEWAEGKCSARAAARKLDVDTHTFQKWVRETEEDIEDGGA